MNAAQRAVTANTYEVICGRALRQIAGVFLVIWVLSTLGILAFTALPSIIVITIIVGLVVAFLGLM